MKKPQNYQKIWTRIGQIPYGTVVTYGQIAAMVGLPRHARLVGYALRNAPDHIDLPWHRVLTAKGESAFSKDSAQYVLQRDLLAEEGIVFIGGRVPLNQFRWSLSLDELLWKP